MAGVRPINAGGANGGDSLASVRATAAGARSSSLASAGRVTVPDEAAVRRAAPPGFLARPGGPGGRRAGRRVGAPLRLRAARRGRDRRGQGDGGGGGTGTAWRERSRPVVWLG